MYVKLTYNQMSGSIYHTWSRSGNPYGINFAWTTRASYKQPCKPKPKPFNPAEALRWLPPYFPSQMSWVLRWDFGEPFRSQGFKPYLLKKWSKFRNTIWPFKFSKKSLNKNDGLFEIGNFWINFVSPTSLKFEDIERPVKGKLLFLDSFFGAQLLDMTQRKT